MRVLHVTNAFPCDGTPEYGIFIKEQIDSLTKLGVRNSVYFINGRTGGRRAYFRALGKLWPLVEEADVIHCHHLFSLLALAPLLIRRKPVVLSFLNDWTHEIKAPIPEMLKRAICRFGVLCASRVIFKSPIPIQFTGRNDILRLPNGVNVERFDIGDKAAARARLGLSPGSRYVLFVSSKNKFRQQKRYDLFAAAIKLLGTVQEGGRIEELVLVNQPRDRALDFFHACDVHVLCSDYEGSPNSVKEALACGVPVLARAVGDVEELLKDVPSCEIVGNTPEAISTAIARSLNSSHDPNAIRNAFLSKGLTSDQVGGRLVSLYAEIAKC